MNPNTCSSSGSDKWAKFFNKTVTTLQPGSPCNDFKGYCDVFMRCRLVDADGPLARLKKAIFNAELYENIAEWIVVSVSVKEMTCCEALSTQCHKRTWNYFCCVFWPVLSHSLISPFVFQAHWWAVLLMGIALIMLMAGFIKICSVHTPSSNPKLPPPKPLPGTVHQRCRCSYLHQNRCGMFQRPAFILVNRSLLLIWKISCPHHISLS